MSLAKHLRATLGVTFDQGGCFEGSLLDTIVGGIHRSSPASVRDRGEL